jgi:5-methylcytosine-specific restriction protein A
MRLGFILFLLTLGGMYHIYSEGKYIKHVMQYKKYFQMAGVGIGGIMMYYFFLKATPDKKKEFLQMSNEYIKYIPIDRNTSNFISPVLDFTNKWAGAAGGAAAAAAGVAANTSAPVVQVGGGRPMAATAEIGGGSGSGGGGGLRRVKRAVSESRKKFVAARQQWKCATCSAMLDFTYEVDHIVPLFLGGTNEVDNLAACCVSCHKKKTLLERI